MQWVAAKFAGEPPAAIKQGYLIVQKGHDSISKNEIKGASSALQIRQYQRGINASAGIVTVHLPGPGKSFAAVVGVDSNDVGYYSNAGRGSVTDSVEVAGKKVFSSAVLHEGMPGVPVNVGLAGAREFALEVKPVGGRKPWDDAAWDQSDWADARITMQDGSTIWLADLPVGPLAGTLRTRSAIFIPLWRRRVR